MPNDFRARLTDPTPILADGAMGTMINRSGTALDACYEHLNVKQPALILDIHREYINAGVEMIETNTFAANRLKLAHFGQAEQVEVINRAGLQLARQAADASADRTVYVAGSIGPTGERLTPYGKLSKTEAASVFEEQAALLANGVDVILLESFDDHHELLLAIETVRGLAPDVPIMAQMRFSQDNRTSLGYQLAQVVTLMDEVQVDVFGVNCGGGPSHALGLVKQIQGLGGHKHVSVMPNAGYPELVHGRVMYPATPDYFGQFADTARGLGAVVIGGCCGSTPAHIQQMRDALAALPVTVPNVAIEAGKEQDATPMIVFPGTPLEQKLKRGEFVFTVEMAPKRGTNVRDLVTAAEMLLDAGADAIDVADNPTGKMKMSPWALAHILQLEVQIDTILHFPTRGRNLLRIQSDLLASHALALKNLFITMGDPTHSGEYPEAWNDFDITPSGLMKLVKHQMNEGSDKAGNRLGEPTTFFVGCALNMAAPNAEKEIKLLDKKVAAGADFALAQVAFDPGVVVNFKQHYEQYTGRAFPIPIVLGVIPLYSYKNAMYLHNEVYGIDIPGLVFDRIKGTDDAPREGIAIAAELVEALRGVVDGAYIIPPFSRYDIAAELISRVR